MLSRDEVGPPVHLAASWTLRGLSMVRNDEEVLAISAPLFDRLYEYLSQAMLLGREPS